jgi:hypothetical protein
LTDQLLDHLVGDGEHPWWHLDAERSRHLQVDDKLEFGRLQHWQIGGLGALEDAAGINTDTKPRCVAVQQVVGYWNILRMRNDCAEFQS